MKLIDRGILARWIRALFTKRIQLSLAVFIPAFLVVFAFGPAFLVYTEAVRKLPPDSNLASLQLPIYLGMVAALVVGLIVATALLKPLRRYLEQKGDASGDPRVQEALSLLGSQVGEQVSQLSRYGHILESLSGGILTLDRKERVTTANTAAEIILGCRAGDLEHRAIGEGAARDLAPWALRALREGVTCSSEEAALTTADGRRITVGLTTSLLRDARLPAAQAGRAVDGVVLSFKDLTQLRQVQEQMQRADRLAGLGTLAAGVAHEVRNPLGSIQGLAQLLLEAFPEGGEKRRYAEVIISEVQRLNRVVEQLLDLARPMKEGRTAQDVAVLLHRAVTLGRLAEKEKAAQIQEGYAPDLPPIQADGERLVQAFLNILLNAAQAIPEHGVIRINAEPPDEAGWLRVCIANTDSHIPSEDRERIFEPFYTTKADGTGLGLAIAHQAVVAHGGRLWVEGDGPWTRFVIELPIGEASQ